MDRLGVVLSGGGIKGVAHIGLLQALKEHGISPKHISGTSAGALVGALYAAGCSSKEMLKFFQKTPIISWFNISTSKPGLLDTEKYRSYLEKYFPENSFEALDKNLIITTTNIEKGEVVYHNSGGLIEPLMASCSVPLVFSPIKIDGALHSDGGIMNNFPVEPLAQMGLPHLLGSYVCAVLPLEPKSLNTSLKIMYRAFDLSQEALCKHKFTQCDFVFAPDELANVGFLDSKSVQKAYEIGYQSAMKNLDTILANLLLDPPIFPEGAYMQELSLDLKEENHSSTTSYLDIWPFNWAFGGNKDKEAEEEKSSI